MRYSERAFLRERAMEESDERQKCTRRGLTASDLHLFSDYTKAKEFLPLLESAIARTQAEMVVLNGDIFDFEYPGNLSFEDGLEKMGFDLAPHSIDRKLLDKLGIGRHIQDDLERYKPMKGVDAVLNLAIAWLWKFSTEHPQTQIHYVLGNHDGVYCPKGLDNHKNRDFCTRMKKLKQVLKEEGKAENFHFHRECFSPAANALFTHGDLPLRKQDIHTRPFVPIDDIRPPQKGEEGHSLRYTFEEMIYSHPALLSFAHHFAGYHNRPGRIDPAVTRAQVKVVKGRRDTFHIFTGHTHVPRTNDEVTRMVKNPLNGEEYQQHFLMHNTGSAVSAREFNLLEFGLRDEAVQREGKEPKTVTVVEGVRRAPEVGTQPGNWANTVKRAAMTAGSCAPLPRV